MSRKIPFTLVLDIDSTLIKAFNGNLPSAEFMSRLHPCTRQRIRYLPGSSIWFVLRPYAEDLLRWTKKYIDEVMIWSAGTDPYVKEIAEQLSVHTDFNLVLTRDHCEPFGEAFTKPLIDITSYGTTKYQLDDRVLLDDKEFSFRYNPKHGILIPEYDPSINDLQAERPGSWDSHLLTFMDYFSDPGVIELFNKGHNITQVREKIPLVFY